MFLIKCDLIFNPYPERVCLFCVVFSVYHIHRLSSSLKWAGFLLHRSLPFTIQRMGSWKMCSNFSSFSENEKMFDPIRERKATYARVDSSAVLCAVGLVGKEFDLLQRFFILDFFVFLPHNSLLSVHSAQFSYRERKTRCHRSRIYLFCNQLSDSKERVSLTSCKWMSEEKRKVFSFISLAHLMWKC